MSRQKQRQRGQALSEYVIAIGMLVVFCIGALSVFVQRAGTFYTDLVHIISLPIP